MQGNITNEYVFMAGRRIARRDSSGHVYYYYPDALGSPLTITDSSGNPCYVANYTPYGQEMATTNTCPQNYKFTGYEQDAETGLYYAFARFYSARLGRFLSPDPLAGDASNPQSLNRYAYVGNNALNAVDPRGLMYISPEVSLMVQEINGGFDSAPGIISADTGAFLGYFSAANGNMGMSGLDTINAMNGASMKATLGDEYYLLPGYANPEEQAEGDYLKMVADGLQKLIEQELKDALKRALSNPVCAELFGGVPSAMVMVDKMTIVDTTAISSIIGTNVAGWTPNSWDDLLGIDLLNKGYLAGSVWKTYFVPNGAWSTKGYNTYVGAAFWGQSASARTTILIHEMSHPYTSEPLGGTVDQPGSPYSYKNIQQKCDTAVPHP